MAGTKTNQESVVMLCNAIAKATNVDKYFGFLLEEYNHLKDVLDF